MSSLTVLKEIYNRDLQKNNFLCGSALKAPKTEKNDFEQRLAPNTLP